MERKSVSDLFGSFASGRLYTQVDRDTIHWILDEKCRVGKRRGDSCGLKKEGHPSTSVTPVFLLAS